MLDRGVNESTALGLVGPLQADPGALGGGEAGRELLAGVTSPGRVAEQSAADPPSQPVQRGEQTPKAGGRSQSRRLFSAT